MPFAREKGAVATFFKLFGKDGEIEMVFWRHPSLVDVIDRDLLVCFACQQHGAAGSAYCPVIGADHMGIGKADSHADEPVHIWCVDLIVPQGMDGVPSLVIREEDYDIFFCVVLCPGNCCQV